MKIIHKAKVNNSSLIFDNSLKLREDLKKFSGDVEVVVKTPDKSRSNNQNRYYWGVVLKLIADHTGYSIDELHEILKGIFLRKRIELETKNGISEQFISKSTAELTTAEMETYLSNIRQWSSLELGCYIPEPNEVSL